ncbi:caspase-9 isoform X2 [Hyperolius riggenbachi]|uniref:caspase-9 isoform X2 n=1 Tax=Hyperolius riggenbachi TaxID=752182 RepID=UPI0035A2DE8B
MRSVLISLPHSFHNSSFLSMMIGMRAGTRRDQARQLLVELETRGTQAYPLFLQCLIETGQQSLADALQDGGGGTVVITPMPAPPTRIPTPVYPLPKEKRPIPVVTPKHLDIEKDYSMNYDPCGYCLIINNMEFQASTNLSYRAGSDIDREKMERRMKRLHFEVSVMNNLKGAQIHTELERLASKDHSKRDCCLVIILSHGCETRHTRFPGGVYGTDGARIPVERIVNYFNGSNCPSLGGKPKLFFIQACGGDEKDRGVAVESGDVPGSFDSSSLQSDAMAVRPDDGDMDETDAVASLPTSGDILVSYSTFPGYVSWRDKKSGTWYVETLDEILEEHASTSDLQTLLVMVANIVSSKGTYKQIPGYFNFLRKRFFFKTD